MGQSEDLEVITVVGPEKLVLLEGPDMQEARRMLVTWPLVHFIATARLRRKRWAAVAHVDPLAVPDLEEFLLANQFIRAGGGVDAVAALYIRELFLAHVPKGSGAPPPESPS